MLDDALSQMREYGLIIRAEDVELGKIRRCDVEGDRPGSKNGWYSLFQTRLDDDTEIIAGAYGSWKSGDSQRLLWGKKRFSRDERKKLNEQIKKQQRQAELLRNQIARRAAALATKAWNGAAQVGTSPYLKRKKVQAYGLRFGKNGEALVPVTDIDGNVFGIQVIYPEKTGPVGDKRYWPKGMKKKGRFFVIGTLERGKPIAFAEGYATAASIHEATEYPVVVTFDSGNIKPCAEAIRSRYPDSPLIFCADDDWKTTNNKGEPWNPGMEKSSEAAEAFGGHLVKPMFSSSRRDADVDFNDLHVLDGIEAVTKAFQYVRSKLTHWRTRLGRTQTGSFKGDTRNIYIILSNDDAWQGVLGWCEFSSRVVKRGELPFAVGANEPINNEWRDDDTSRTDVWLAEKYGISAKDSIIDKAIDLAARDNAFHPVRDYLNSLEWDGNPRVDVWLSICLGAEQSEYTRAVGAKFLLGAVARVMEYPTKHDSVLILEGKQGAGKSTVFKILGGQWYSDTHFALGEKDGYQQMQGVWIVELAELDSFNKAESTRAKQFFASETDRYRPSYGRRVHEYARQCVFAGTTNQDNYLIDPTGNRRYWPVHCRKIDLDALRTWRDQLWAEAVTRYRQGERWHVHDNELHLFESEQENRYMSDPWESLVEDWLDEPVQTNTRDFTMAEIFQGALGMEPGHMRKPEQHRLAQILTRLGFKRAKLRLPSGRRKWAYRRPETGPQEVASEHESSE